MSDTNSGGPSGGGSGKGAGGHGERPDPIEDVRKGLGLLFRAAKSALESLPTGKVEDVVLNGAREVGRALENVTETLDKQIFKRDKPPHDREPTQPTDHAAAPRNEAPKDAAAKATTPEGKQSDPPKGPRVE